ncbi:MAG: ATP-binding protein [Propionibacteriaceae bacterium]|nr:ATP-binding protein [Propionibacteriaceae bacterium]
MEYSRRIVDDELDQLLPYLPAIALEGAKGVGKTATASGRAAAHVDLANRRQRLVIEADPVAVTGLPEPTFIDEWQLVPEVWDVVKTSVDDRPTGGRFSLAGSAGPTKDVRIHSGAGRIVRLAVRPMVMPERGLVAPTVSLAALLAGRPDLGGVSELRVADYVDEILRSGFPAVRALPEQARRAQLDSYLQRIVDHDLEENGARVRRPAALTAWLTAYAAATATTAAYTTILNAATAGEAEKPARQTVATYREELLRLYILDPVPAWTPALSPLKRLGLSPKHHLVDPALAARLLGATSASLLRGEGETVAPDSTLLGALFESLVTQTVRVLAQAAEASTYHLRTGDGTHEIDLVVEAADRRVLAIEVKLSDKCEDRDTRHLAWLKSQLGGRVVDAMVVNTGPVAYRRPDGVAVVPLALLGP